LADSIREVALAMSSDALHAPPRLALPLQEGGVLLVMPASDAEISITKLVTVHPENQGRGLPTIQGEVVVMNATTGERLGLLEGGVLTARRTAALSMLAARELAPQPGGPLLVVGAGAQGRAHLDAFHAGLGVSKVFTSSRSQKSAAVGSFEPGAAELPPALISASRVFVDTVEGAKDEAGDLIQAESAGAFDWEDATTLESALRSSGRPEGTIVFKSVGHALWDLAAARTAFVGEARSEPSA
jgi:ornithine cyclodeaminase